MQIDPSAPSSLTTNGELSAAPSRQELSRAVGNLNAASDSSSSRQLSISIDPHTQQPVVRVVDSSSGEVMGQVPLEYVLRIADLLAAEKDQVNFVGIS